MLALWGSYVNTNAFLKCWNVNFKLIEGSSSDNKKYSYQWIDYQCG